MTQTLGRPLPENETSTDQLIALAEGTATRAGVRLTKLRKYVYRLLLEADEPLGAYDILSRLQGVGCPRPPTAYRALECLEALGLVRKLKSVAKYVALKSGPTQAPLTFLVCQKCGSAEQLVAADESKALRDKAYSRGFSQIHPTIELLGYCSDHPSSPETIRS